ncbi:MAG TPA: TonB-dependent receptor [Thermoanaerobaculia bacterium]|nr:TonB-dependent receptor [Thermoanaerobaculia bacterium]
MTGIARASLAAALLAAPLVGQDTLPPDETATPRVKEEVAVVATRLDVAPVSATVRVVTREEIAAMPGVRAVPDVLMTVVGIDVRRRGLYGTQADIGIRGSDFNGTLLLVDGQPATDPQSGHLSADFDVPLGAVERIEILSGGGSALWGSSAVGGVVNIVTRGADLGRSNMQCETHYGHGSHSLDAGGYRAAMRVSGSVSAAVDWERTENSGFRDDTESASGLLRVSGRWDTRAGPVALGLGYASRNFGAYSFYGTTFPNQQESTRTRTATLSSTLTLGGWTLTPSAFVRAHHDDFVLVRSDPSFYENLHDTVTGLVRAAARHALFGGTLAFGAEAGRETISSTNLGSHGRDHGALFTEFAHAWDAAAPAAGSLRAGLRLDMYEGYGSRLSPYAGAAWGALPGLTLRTSFGTSFRAPSFTELYYVDPQNVGNPDLRPEKAWNAEVGTALAAGALTLDAAYFHRHATDLIDFVRSSPSEPFSARNVRQADTDGVEASADWTRGRPAFLTQLRIQAAYLFVDLASLSAAAGGATQGKYVLDPLHAKWDVAAGVTLPLGLSATSRLSYFSRPSFADGVWLLSARLSWQVFQGRILEFFVDGDNLGNVRYEEVAGVPLPRRTFFGGFNLTW